jgi:tetratricopeptide (TPR) repeat protein
MLPVVAVALLFSAHAASNLDSARAARDSADVAALRARIAQIRKPSTLPALLEVSQLNLWLCEALYALNNEAGVKRAAQAAVDASQQAVVLDPASSEAHRLLGDSLGQLIPHVFAGGMRYGARSTKELDRALELDPRNAEAHIARAAGYFFTPSMFGGDKQKAIEHLQTALSIDPSNDSAHLWLAQVYADLKQKDRAAAEITEALRINPKRGYTRYIAGQLGVRHD